MLEEDAQTRREENDGWNIGKQLNGAVALFLSLGLAVLSMQ